MKLRLVSLLVAVATAGISASHGEAIAVFAEKSVRTFCYGFLAVAPPIYLSELGLSPQALGVAVALMLIWSGGPHSAIWLNLTFGVNLL